MESDKQSEGFEALCTRLDAQLSPEQRLELDALVVEVLQTLERSREDQKELLRGLGFHTNLDDRDERYRRLRVVAHYLGYSEEEFWSQDPRDLYDALALKVWELDRLAGKSNNLRFQPGGDTEVKVVKEDSVPPSTERVAAIAISKPTDRRACVDRYIEEVFNKTGKRIKRTAIWKEAGDKTRAEFERWESGWYERRGRKPNKAADKRFTRILTKKPHLK